MGGPNTRRVVILAASLGVLVTGAAIAHGQDLPLLPSVTIGVNSADKPGQVSVLLQILFLLTVLSLAPAIVVMMTSFTRLAVVFSLVRHALGTQQMPPNQILVGLALLLTFFLMSPVYDQINKEALQPYLAEEISQDQAIERALQPIRKFMFRQTRQKDIALFMKVSGKDRPRNPDDIPTLVLIPSFVISELKTAFQIGFMIYIPFLVIDMVVASVLLSMGMMMLPPFMISLPFKLMLFVLIDGWNLLVGSMVRSFG
ncbi:MAG: flagellar type III secretion system pore protein FliP [Deltaproteobacteria bacterium]|nr:flagellar type III secretion system pore protein FliP [Deltaproteobacteria bacterium]MBW1922742.1 flagellar type III secretion system pore protein FliP [Deltaproteobacteria bacterium]MBW1948184.1 flagellar type III secretion system pore protein FliP [Deltaproteobacteria bacterium]MBW2007429.1 flagellar type III secretion system pore protein FliP [Deltaproteobacteria bacterium]MBW2102802.1 flagellar type III secretion system pore protein FliP [Deltaproteobacteria bacterium]